MEKRTVKVGEDPMKNHVGRGLSGSGTYGKRDPDSRGVSLGREYQTEGAFLIHLLET